MCLSTTIPKAEDPFPIQGASNSLLALLVLQNCRTAFLYVANIDTISTGSGMGVHEAECLPVAQLFTKRQIPLS